MPLQWACHLSRSQLEAAAPAAAPVATTQTAPAKATHAKSITPRKPPSKKLRQPRSITKPAAIKPRPRKLKQLKSITKIQQESSNSGCLIVNRREAPLTCSGKCCPTPGSPGVFHQGLSMLRRYRFEIILGTLIVCGLIASFLSVISDFSQEIIGISITDHLHSG